MAVSQRHYPEETELPRAREAFVVVDSSSWLSMDISKDSGRLFVQSSAHTAEMRRDPSLSSDVCDVFDGREQGRQSENRINNCKTSEKFFQ